jgi:hypothetical protein
MKPYTSFDRCFDGHHPVCKSCRQQERALANRCKLAGEQIQKLVSAPNQTVLAAVCRDLLEAFNRNGQSFSTVAAELLREGSPAQKQRIVLAVLKLLSYLEIEDGMVNVSSLSDEQLEGLAEVDR